MANILFLYDETQTYTQTVYEYLLAFSKFSKNKYYFVHVSATTKCDVDVNQFDAIAIHYSVRLPYDMISDSWTQKIAQFDGKKFLFIQDEYDYTKRSWFWINLLGIDTVFTCVPTQNISKVYPTERFPKTKFFNVLTGYVPTQLPKVANLREPMDRKNLVGYRGRPLHARYGALGQEKIQISKLVKSYAKEHNHLVDIEWDENKRIYGDQWYEFVASTRATLGTESGANLFDWDGDLMFRLDRAKTVHADKSDLEILTKVLGAADTPGLMNQISPRVFEAIALRTALVLYPGDYSGVLQPHKHYIPLQKDGSNLADVFEQLNQKEVVESITENAYVDIVASNDYQYSTFVSFVDDTVNLPQSFRQIDPETTKVQEFPTRWEFQHFGMPTLRSNLPTSKKARHLTVSLAQRLGSILPSSIRKTLAPIAKKMLRV